MEQNKYCWFMRVKETRHFVFAISMHLASIMRFVLSQIKQMSLSSAAIT